MAFRTAVETGDTQALRQLLAEDAVLYTDGGGKRPAALNPVSGADKILRHLSGICLQEHCTAAMEARTSKINGLPGFVLREQAASTETVVFAHRHGRIIAIYVTRNPDKLRHVRF